ncbi:MAG: GTPase, partial [Planctomycetota bacterium]
MGIPRVVIVGRPNVGKSSLFNWLAGRRIAIVDSASGVTRDRVTYLLEVEGRYAEIVDTGGMGVNDSDDLSNHIEEQISTAIDAADVILFVVDTRSGPAPLDDEVAKRLRYVRVPILCVANKTDSWEWDPEADAFYRFGHKVLAVSAEQSRGKETLLEAIHERLPKGPAGPEIYEEPTMKVAIVGRRNTGKSTFVNTLAEAERMIVSEVPGTTRDSVDVRFELDGKAFI